LSIVEYHFATLTYVAQKKGKVSAADVANLAGQEPIHKSK